LKASYAVSVKSIGRLRDDPGLEVKRQQANGSGRVNPIHDRRLHVHQYDIVVTNARHTNGHISLLGKIRMNTELRQQAKCNFLINGVVFLDQNSQ
jgi:hypothetical protein